MNLVQECTIEFYSAFIAVILWIATKRRKSKRMSSYYFEYMLLSLVLFLLSDAFLIFFMVKHVFDKVLLGVLSFFAYAFSVLVIDYFYFYVLAFLREYKGIKVKSKKKMVYWVTALLFILYIVGLCTSLFFVLTETGYSYTPYFGIVILPLVFILCPAISVIFQSRKKLSLTESLVWSSYILIPVGFRIFDIFIGTDVMPVALTGSVLFMFITINQETEIKLHEKNVAFRQQEMEIQKTRQKVIMSQIQPHFLYNVLNTICILCRKDPDLAAKTTSDFATYLRMNLNSVDQNEPVSFSEEMKHTQIYLDLEKLRFGNTLNIEYNINTTSFYLPVLSLQPIVENAVKHGICMKDEDGTLRISTFDKEDHYVIIVEDNGVGFDTSMKMDDGVSHIGIVNTRKRIEAMCNGTMEIASEIGRGTKVTIRLPKSSNTSFRIIDTMHANLLI